MTQTRIESGQAGTPRASPGGRPIPRPAKPREFRYRILPGLAVSSTVLGVLSMLSFLSWAFAVIPVAGFAMGWVAMRRIRKAPEEVGGIRYAQWGMALSALLGVAGTGTVTYLYYTQAPPGYRAISFAQLRPDPRTPTRLPDIVNDLEEKKVFIRGYMVPGRQRVGIKAFILVGSIAHCRFCGPRPQPTDMIEVVLTHDLELDYTTQMIGVGGRFTAKPDPLHRNFGGVAYQIEADVIR